MKKILSFLLALQVCFATTSIHAQGTVTQSGSVTAGNLATWKQDGVIQDSGTPVTAAGLMKGVTGGTLHHLIGLSAGTGIDPEDSGIAYGVGVGPVVSVAGSCGLLGGPIVYSGTLQWGLLPVTKSGASYAVAPVDCGNILVNTGTNAAWSLPGPSPTNYAGLGFWIVNSGTGALTLTPATGTINSGSNYVIQAGNAVFTTSDGISNYTALAFLGAVAPASLAGNNTWIGTNNFTGGFAINGSPVQPTQVDAYTPSGTGWGTSCSPSCTWTKAQNATVIRVFICGPGGPGGGGAMGTFGTDVATGGAGGGGGGCTESAFDASQIAPTVTVTPAASPAGGSGAAVHGSGAQGTVGGNSTFGSYLTGYAGGAGGPGQIGIVSVGGSGGAPFAAGANASTNALGPASGGGSGATAPQSAAGVMGASGGAGASTSTSISGAYGTVTAGGPSGGVMLTTSVTNGSAGGSIALSFASHGSGGSLSTSGNAAAGGNSSLLVTGSYFNIFTGTSAGSGGASSSGRGGNGGSPGLGVCGAGGPGGGAGTVGGGNGGPGGPGCIVVIQQ